MVQRAVFLLTVLAMASGCGGNSMVMREMFAEARADLVSTLAVLSGSRDGEGGLPNAAAPGEAPRDKGASSPPAPESAEGTIERILKTK